MTGWWNERQGEAKEAERLYRSIVSAYPDDVEAWNLLGDVVAIDDRRGKVALARMPVRPSSVFSAIDPNHSSALTHMPGVALAEGNLAELELRTEELLRQSPSLIEPSAGACGSLDCEATQDCGPTCCRPSTAQRKEWLPTVLVAAS